MIPPLPINHTGRYCGGEFHSCPCPPLEKVASLFLGVFEYLAPRLPDPAERQRLAEGMALWVMQRPKRRRKIAPKDFPTQKQAAEREWVERYGALPALADLAAMLGISRRTLVTYLQGLDTKNAADP